MGNFSKHPDAILKEALERGYSRLLFQQGKPVLDRDLNLLASLASFHRLVPYLGDGVPAGSNGFAVSNIHDDDFDIADGVCLVNGQEARLATPTTYKTQPNNGNVGLLPEGKSKVYLQVFLREVDETQDSELGNPGDVGIETSVREKTDWEIVVSKTEINKSDHFILAEIDTTNNEVVDHRRQALTLAALRDELDRARGSLHELGQRLDTSLLADGKLREGAVAEPILADTAVSKRAIADGAVPIQKLSRALIFNARLSVPASGEVPLTILEASLGANAHAFLLVSVICEEAFFGEVDWHLRVVRRSFTNQHFQQIVLVNKQNTPATVSCKAYRLNED